MGTGLDFPFLLLIEFWKCVRFEEAMAFEYREYVNSSFSDAIDDTIGTKKDLPNVIPLQFRHHAAS